MSFISFLAGRYIGMRAPMAHLLRHMCVLCCLCHLTAQFSEYSFSRSLLYIRVRLWGRKSDCPIPYESIYSFTFLLDPTRCIKSRYRSRPIFSGQFWTAFLVFVGLNTKHSQKFESWNMKGNNLYIMHFCQTSIVKAPWVLKRVTWQWTMVGGENAWEVGPSLHRHRNNECVVGGQTDKQTEKKNTIRLL